MESRMETGEQSPPAGRWAPLRSRPMERMSARLLCSGECRSGSLAPSAKPPVQPPRLSEKRADSDMCGLDREISVGRESRDNGLPDAGMRATAWGLCVPFPGFLSPPPTHTYTSAPSGSSWQASLGASLHVCLELAAVFLR